MYRCALAMLFGCAASPPPAPAQPPPVVTTPLADADDDADACPDALLHDTGAPAPSMAISATEWIGRKMQAHAPELRACWLHYWRDHHDSTGGRMTISFRLHKDRAPDHFRTRGFSEEVDHCVCHVVAQIDFERLSEANVDYPLYFALP